MSGTVPPPVHTPSIRAQEQLTLKYKNTFAVFRYTYHLNRKLISFLIINMRLQKLLSNTSHELHIVRMYYIKRSYSKNVLSKLYFNVGHVI